MKVCILSMQRVDNMGSLLQAYALKTILEQQGNEIEFIDIMKRNEDYKLLGADRKEFLAESEKSGLIGKIKKIDKYILIRFRNKKKNKQQRDAFESFRKNQLNIGKISSQYDVCVIGSDEVFNCLDSGTWGFTSQLFGNVPEANKVITYAASCGSTKYEDLPCEVAKRICQAFEKVAAFSTRDKNTHDFVAKLTDKNVTDNIDPVLLYDFEQEMEEVDLPKLPEHFCIVYSYYNRLHTYKEIRAIKSFCDRHRLTPVTIGAPQFWIKNHVVCTPFQCLKTFASADFVITDTFHGTIFASKYAKKFAVLVRESNENKLLDLVNTIGIRDHLLGSIEDVEEKYKVSKNQKKFISVIEEERMSSWQYLKDNI